MKIYYKKRQYHPVELGCKILFSSLVFFFFFSAFSFTQFSRSNDGLHSPLTLSAHPLQPRREYDLTTAAPRVHTPQLLTARFHRASVQVRPECGWAGSGCSPWQHRSWTPSPPVTVAAARGTWISGHCNRPLPLHGHTSHQRFLARRPGVFLHCLMRPRYDIMKL